MKFLNFRDSLVSNVQFNKIYVLKSIRKNSKYEYRFSQEWIEQNSNKI